MTSPVHQFPIHHNLYAPDAHAFNYDGVFKSKNIIISQRHLCTIRPTKQNFSCYSTVGTIQIIKPFGNISLFLSTFLLVPLPIGAKES